MNRFLLIYLAGAAIAVHAEPLADILARMDRDAPAFKAMSAKIHQVEYTAVIQESSESEGEVRLRRAKTGSVMLFEYQKPDSYQLRIDRNSARKYFPNAHEVQIYEIGKLASKLKVDELLLIGFGTSGTALKADYTATDGGAATIAGQRTTRIELVPKSDEVRKYATRIELWIPEGGSNAVQVKVTQPSKDYKLVTYSDPKLNPPLPDSAFELKVPPGTKETRFKN